MEKTTFLEYKGKGFWISEYFIELLSHYICQTFESIGISTFNQNLVKIYGNCAGNREGISYGMVDILFDEYITNTTDKNTLISVFNQTKTLIGGMGTEISVNQLNQFEENVRKFDNNPGWWEIPIKTSSLIATLDLLISLLNEEYEGTNASINYEGWPTRNGQTVI